MNIPPQGPLLELTYPYLNGHKHFIFEKKVTLGRGGDVGEPEIHVSFDRSISPLHAELTVVAGSPGGNSPIAELTCLGQRGCSVTGVFYRGNPTKVIPILEGDIIGIGETQFIVTLPSPTLSLEHSQMIKRQLFRQGHCEAHNAVSKKPEEDVVVPSQVPSKRPPSTAPSVPSAPVAVKKPQSLRVTVYIAMATALAKDHTTRLNSDEITTLVNEIVPPGTKPFMRSSVTQALSSKPCFINFKDPDGGVVWTLDPTQSLPSNLDMSLVPSFKLPPKTNSQAAPTSTSSEPSFLPPPIMSQRARRAKKPRQDDGFFVEEGEPDDVPQHHYRHGNEELYDDE